MSYIFSKKLNWNRSHAETDLWPTESKISGELNRIFYESNYDVRLRPFFGTGHPVNVRVGIDVAQITSISEVNMGNPIVYGP